jgi:hypothetical protein
MKSTIFGEYLAEFNGIMIAQNCKVVLILDNAPSHPNIPLSNVKLIFLPPNKIAES